MTVRLQDSLIRLEGRCRLEDAETLLRFILADRQAQVDLAACTAMHMAVAQILIASGATVVGRPANAFLAAHLLPLLSASASASAMDRPRL